MCAPSAVDVTQSMLSYECWNSKDKKRTSSSTTTKTKKNHFFELTFQFGVGLSLFFLQRVNDTRSHSRTGFFDDHDKNKKSKITSFSERTRATGWEIVSERLYSLVHCNDNPNNPEFRRFFYLFSFTYFSFLFQLLLLFLWPCQNFSIFITITFALFRCVFCLSMCVVFPKKSLNIFFFFFLFSVCQWNFFKFFLLFVSLF